MKLSVQMYSLRHYGDFDAQLGLLREVGFEWLESVATHELLPAVFSSKLAQYGLRLSSMHASLWQLEQQMVTLLSACQLTECRLIVMPYLALGDRPYTASGWSTLGRRLAALGEILAQEGIQLAYHNHDFEFLLYEGKSALEWLYAAADPNALGWEVDVGWLVRAGCDANDWEARLGERICAVHIKDLAREGQASEEDGWTTLGAGTVPWSSLCPILQKRTQLFVFEHDNPRAARSQLRDSLAFMKQHLLLP